MGITIRLFWCALGGLLWLFAVSALVFGQTAADDSLRCAVMDQHANKTFDAAKKAYTDVKIFLCGDVMTGRGIDQVLAQPSNPILFESYVKDARDHVRIAEEINGRIAYPVHFAYIWGDALKEFERIAPDVKIINLETSVTTSNAYWKGKGINYRMHTGNVPVLTAAGIDICALANNHVLDWGYDGLFDTLEAIQKVNIKSTGAGRTLSDAQAPAVKSVPGKGRVLVFAFGLASSGIPQAWIAGRQTPGVYLLRDLSHQSLLEVQQIVANIKRRGDIVVASIHWGGNWGYHIPLEQISFAHQLIETGGVDIVHGHSSHHVKAIEVYHAKLILYGCGDFINDYEGIGGYENFRPDLSLMYFATLDPTTGKLLDLQMTPTQIKRFQVKRASRGDARWLKTTLTSEGSAFGTRAEMTGGDNLKLIWD